MDLTHALGDGYRTVLVVEAVVGEGAPGAVSVAESLEEDTPSRALEMRCSITETTPSRDLSPPVQAAVERAVAMIEGLVGDLVPSERTEGARVE